ncbi:MAG: flap endonuclease-1 [Candidatus Poseidoniia archaeon]|nr:flap endonuclease-1 [Candidatus Poseidoniia archaeon]
MGIKLGPLLETRPIKIEELTNRKVAIDGYNVLYQFLSSIRQADGNLLTDSEGRVTSHLSGLFFRLSNLVDNGIRPCIIFDGKPPKLKKKLLEERRLKKIKAEVEWEAALSAGDTELARTKAQQTTRLDKSMLVDSKKLLDMLGIPWFDAPSEGEAQVAHLLESNKVDYGASQDFDTILFGARKFVRNLTLSNRRKLPKQNKWVPVTPEIIDLDLSLSNLEISREQLVDVAILMGTDFNPGIDGIGPKKGLKLVRECGDAESSLEKIGKKIDNLHDIRSLFLNPEVGDFDPIWNPPDATSLENFLCNDYRFNRERVMKTIEIYTNSKSKARQFTLGDF